MTQPEVGVPTLTSVPANTTLVKGIPPKAKSNPHERRREPSCSPRCRVRSTQAPHPDEAGGAHTAV
ncbi:hypothetical protein ABZY45_12685 [Streptomyces sp. NPDC006516]|uniref:hypothetical protein n=1 Tax=Streptomyces sp. NPDC006516 TaxID=3154309 RepID=UPI0033B6F81E